MSSGKITTACPHVKIKILEKLMDLQIFMK
jgi:hypothetical protein